MLGFKRLNQGSQGFTLCPLSHFVLNKPCIELFYTFISLYKLRMQILNCNPILYYNDSLQIVK